MTTLANISALESHAYVSGDEIVFVQGYYTIADGGEGLFLWNSAITSGYNTGTIIQYSTSTSGGWKRLYTGSISVKWFGAISGNTSFNNTTPIQNAVNAANAESTDTFIPGGSYTILSQLYLKGKIYGYQNLSKIIIGSTFSFSDPIAGRSYTAILNHDFQGEASIYANYISIEDLDIIYEENQGVVTSPTALGLANVYAGNLTNCSITVQSGLVGNVTAFELWACVQNFDITECTINNLNTGKQGGSIWVRNITNDGSNIANDVSNILIANCNISHASVDEAVSVFGVQGKISELIISGLSIQATAPHSTLLSVFPLNNGTSEGVYAAVENIIVEKCTFIDPYFTAHVLRIGNSADSAQVCDNILVKDNFFKAQYNTSDSNIRYVARNIKCVGNNVSFVNNSIDTYINGVNSTLAINYGIGGYDKVTNNYITNNIQSGIYACSVVENNTIDSIVGKGLENSVIAIGNKIKCAQHGILCQQSSTQYLIHSNYIEITGSGTNIVGIFIQSLSSSTPEAEINSNIINMNSGNFSIQNSSTGLVRVLNNKIIGSGKSIYGPQLFNEIRENIWYGISDDIRSIGIIDTNHNAASPIGSNCYYVTTTTSGSPIGFIKTANTGASSDWSAMGTIH